jgi:hypothetical protein
MGIDNEARLFFGIQLSEEDMKKISDVFGADMESALMEENKDLTRFEDKYPGLYLGYYCDYYDGDPSYYLGIVPDVLDSYSISDMKELLEKWETSGYKEFLEVYEIEYNEPRMIAVPHVS